MAKRKSSRRVVVAPQKKSAMLVKLPPPSERARMRLDHFREPGSGRVFAVITVALAGGNELRFTASCSLATAMRVARSYGVKLPAGNVEGFFGDIIKGVGKVGKGIGKVAKGIATSKVLKTATGALGVLAPALGPLGPVALGASGALKVAQLTLAAKGAHKRGNKAAAKKLLALAAVQAKKAAPSARMSPAAMMAQGSRGGNQAFALLLRPV